MQGADLLIRNHTVLSVQGTPQHSHPQPFTHSHTDGPAISNCLNLSIFSYHSMKPELGIIPLTS